MNRTSNKQTIKEEFIKNYFNRYRKVPSTFTIENQYDFNVDLNTKSYGINYNKKPSAEANVSYTIEKHKNDIESLYMDFDTLRKRQLKLIQQIQHVFKTFNNTQKKHLKLLKKLELEVSKELLLKNVDDSFIYGKISDFKIDQKDIDFDKSNISILEDGRVTLALNRVSSETFQNVSLDYYSNSTTHDVVDRKNLFDIKNLLEEDGSIFQHVAYTRFQDSVVNLSLNLKFNNIDGQSIDKLKVNCRTDSGGAKTNISVYYSKDYINYTLLEMDSVVEPNSGINYFDIYDDNIKDIRIVLSKRAYDYKRGNLYGYSFGIDFIGLTKAEYEVNQNSYLFTKAYEFKDTDGNPYNFNFATIKEGTCCTVPTQSSIQFFLSKNAADWYPCSIDGTGPGYVQFENDIQDIHSLIVDDSNPPSFITNTFKSTSNPSLTYQSAVLEEFGISLTDSEALMNYYIPVGNIDKISKESIKIFRDVNRRYSISGFLKVSNTYKTKLFVNDRDGIYLNFGSDTIKINGLAKSGNTFLRYGEHDIIVTQSLDNETEQLLNLNPFSNVSSLKNFDKKYPYNHFLLLTGYSYPNSFVGEKVYTNPHKVYSYLLNPVSNVKFNASENDDYSIYTLIENEFGLFFKIKKKNTDTKLEAIDLEYKTKSIENNSNKLYLKAILKSNNRNITPKIHSVKVRVI